MVFDVETADSLLELQTEKQEQQQILRFAQDDNVVLRAFVIPRSQKRDLGHPIFLV